MAAFAPGAVFWSIVATLAYRADPSSPGTDDPALWELVLLYASVALVSGAVFGLLREWATSPARHALMSMAVGFPLTLGLALVLEHWNFSALGPWHFGLAISAAVLLGPPFGAYFRDRFSSRTGA